MPWIHTGRETVAGGGLRLFSIYTDGLAAANERWAVSQIKLAAGHTRLLRSDCWKLDTLLARDSMKKTAGDVAALADILVIAISSLEQRDEHLIRWLDSIAHKTANPGAPRLLIGLLGVGQARAGQLDWYVKQLIRHTRSTGVNFIWHWMGHDAVADADFMAEHIANLLAAKHSVAHASAAG